MIRWLHRVIRCLDDLIWPRGMSCLLCDELAEGGMLCGACQKDLQARRLRQEASDVRSAYRYRGPAGRLVKLLKDKAVADAADELARGMAEVVREMDLPPDTVLTWVSMPRRRYWMRGIDHGATLCGRLGELLDMPVKRLLVRTKNVHTQRGLNRAQRLRNLRGVFACTERIDSPVLLVDDVLTTGSTVRACTQVLLKAGAHRVYAITATRVEDENHYDQL